MDSEPYVDDLYFSALYDEDEIFPVSDEKYAEELQMQEALMSSVLVTMASRTSETKTQTPGEQSDAGESSVAFCGICMDRKPGGEMFRNNSCRHTYCTECIGRHVAVKIQENISSVRCPDVSCPGTIDPHLCRPILPREVFERWEDAICESLVLGSERFYCPYADCSAMMVDDGGEAVTASECPNCRRLFCAQCRVAWHAGLDCGEFRVLNADERGRDDVMMLGLAKEKQWRRCPFCKFFVEKKSGCLHILCRYGSCVSL
ncbi:unnamed protein product [Cuscuta campestris]|uniref:RBR-type E3 ubiquitin transferase n=1 Tax=Cuscuta campestris TaxID=132261 RepID=A0A484M6S6_9ASTE|nr:unnamed protein product [Cuscuta campestris]